MKGKNLMPKEDFSDMPSVVEITFEIWWNEFNKEHYVPHIDKYELAKAAFLAGRKVVINRRIDKIIRDKEEC